MSQLQAQEAFSDRVEEAAALTPEAVEALGEATLAQVFEFPAAEQPRPGMEATLAFVKWAKEQNSGPYAKFTFAEYQHDEGGTFYVRDGEKRYLPEQW